VPAFCRGAATLHPVDNSSIDIEVWLPENWKGKYEAVGGGGWAGVISYPAMAAALEEGYATSSTDTGHKGPNAEFAPGHREKMTDYGYRAVHEMTVAAKLLISAHYGRDRVFPTGTAALLEDARVFRKHRCIRRTMTASSPVRRPTIFCI
jgi:feruloyl esterase